MLFIAFALAYAAGLIIVYSQKYFFIFDDTALISYASHLPIADIFSQALIGFYRPAVFALLKVQYSFFGWDNPGGDSAVSMAVHAISAILFYRLLQDLRFGNAAVLAAGLFLASPWATEATFWMSSQFDVFSVVFSMTSFLLFARYLDQRSPTLLLGSLALFAMALLCKETSVVLPLFYTAIAVRKRGLRPLGQLIGPLIPFVLAAAAYLVLRSWVLSSLGGAYGSIGNLYFRANLGETTRSFIEALLFLNGKFFYRAAPLSFVYTGVVLVCLAAALARPLVAAFVTLLLAAALAPVLWAGASTLSTANGRFLYMPGLPWCLLVGIGGAVLWRRLAMIGGRPFAGIGRAAAVGLLAGLLATAYVSTISQIRLWRFATALARNTVEYILSHPEMAAPAVHITNLPSLATQGPYLLKTYNLEHHLRGRQRAGGPAFSADTVIVSTFDPELQLPAGRDIFGAAGTQDRAVVLTLPLADLRPR
ncbi:glycosyltransferase family 39 protein [Roseicella aerolata]|uniref:Glycosyltransferase family 39 protein n=1 Tax=Roseicella aerolata TaxID=2883479 RepID=A0A9X1LDE0_9PROT|nr:glycosyltransferase family 39 protein [Roseicella aerolata]MCB4825008.1 glycosyltransferase family 39 protein [Roseicella aerolata]